MQTSAQKFLSLLLVLLLAWGPFSVAVGDISQPMSKTHHASTSISPADSEGHIAIDAQNASCEHCADKCCINSDCTGSTCSICPVAVAILLDNLSMAFTDTGEQHDLAPFCHSLAIESLFRPPRA